jgi:digeranylgeranylglycerophospholipid reductase
MYDIAIAGGGCTGNYLALVLSELGFKVIVIEQKSNAGLNICCTGIVSAECYELISNRINLKASVLNKAHIVAPYSHTLDIQSNSDIAYIIERTELEKSLATGAINNGATIIYSTTVKNITTTTDRVYIDTSKSGKHEQFESRIAVITTGYGSRLPLSAGLGNIDRYIIGAQTEIETLNCNGLEIYLDKNIAPAGFAWLVPTWNNMGFAGLLCQSSPVLYMDRFLQQLKARGAIASGEYVASAQPIPVKPLNNTFSERILIVGEAAGQVKPLTGGGIYYGVICADIAIEVIKDAFQSSDFSRQLLSVYQHRWHKLLIKELNTSYQLRAFWEKLNNKTIGTIFGIAEKFNIEERINNTQNIYFDWHSKTISNLISSLIPFAKHK